MSTQPQETTPHASGFIDEKGSDASMTPPTKVEDIERSVVEDEIDAATEAKVLRKLDIRIVPMLCWIYLMNFMDRGVYRCSGIGASLKRHQSILEMLVSTVWRKISIWTRTAINSSSQSPSYSSPMS